MEHQMTVFKTIFKQNFDKVKLEKIKLIHLGALNLKTFMVRFQTGNQGMDDKHYQQTRVGSINSYV